MPARKSNDPTRAFINRNYVIRITVVATGKSLLVGAGQYHKHLKDEKLAEKHFKKVLNSKEDNTTFKLRNRLKIDFLGK